MFNASCPRCWALCWPLPGVGVPPSQTGGNHSDFPATVRIGVLANRGSAQCLAMWGTTADYLTAHVPGHRFEIVSLGYADAEPAIARGRSISSS